MGYVVAASPAAHSSTSTLAIIAIVIAGASCVIALGSLAVSVRADRRASRRERRDVAVGCWYARQEIREDWPVGEPMILVRAVNRGHRPVELRGMYFLADTGEAVTPSRFGDDLPMILRDGESFNAHVDEFRIEEAAAEAGVSQVAWVALSDAEGNEYTASYPTTPESPS